MFYHYTILSLSPLKFSQEISATHLTIYQHLLSRRLDPPITDGWSGIYHLYLLKLELRARQPASSIILTDVDCKTPSLLHCKTVTLSQIYCGTSDSYNVVQCLLFVVSKSRPDVR